MHGKHGLIHIEQNSFIVLLFSMRLRALMREGHVCQLTIPLPTAASKNM